VGQGRARFRNGKNIVSRRALKGNPSTSAARSKNDKGTAEGNSSFPLSGTGVAISFPVPPEYQSTNGIETVWGYIAFEEETEIQLFVAIADGERHDDPRRPKEDHGKLIFFRLLPARFFSSVSFLLFSLFSTNERRNSGIIGLYVSPPRQYTRGHTFLRKKEPIPTLLRYHYVTESHLCPEKSELYRNSVSRRGKLRYYFRYLDSRV